MHWEAPAFLSAAEAWIRERADVTGAIEQPHVRPWSTVLRVPTAEGALWFKANASIHRFEAALAERLVAAVPDRVVELVAADVERGWMLMRDAGTRLRDLEGSLGQLRHWERILPLYAELQLAFAGRDEELIALGVPDHRPARLPALLDEVLDHDELLLVGKEDGLTAEELERLRRDLHDGQLFVRDGRYRVLDWGDSCVSHPFHTMVVTIRAFAYKHGLEPGGPEALRLRDAYLEAFGPGLERAFELAYRTGTLARAIAWYRYVTAAPGLEYADSIPYGLKMFLAGGPIGSWEP